MPDAAEASVFFIGNATTLIRSHGFTLLTDPNFLHRGQRAYLGWGISTRRRTNPAIEISLLPEVDAVVLSHMHGDHWDRVARDGLDPDLPIITTPHAAERLTRQGFRNAISLETWQDRRLRRGDNTLTITALPARHAPGFAEKLLPPVMGSMLEFGRGGGEVGLRLHISGDTLLDERLAAIPKRFPEIDLAIVHLGGTKLLGTLLVTMDGTQGAHWVELINPSYTLPVHYDDYEAFSSGLDDFRHHVNRLGLSGRVRYITRGETYHLLGRRTGHGAR
ncbi:MBL fold metallo-hydrolase [Sphaerisporangium sp. NPDC049002]|uniref:MBL fold metallo-hydrolase n=1 Tax=Sphaerisporangium sp. NPDC049002 TaxID=3155392 RepID=UPI0033F78191